MRSGRVSNRVWICCITLGCSLAGVTARGAEVQLKNGTILPGNAKRITQLSGIAKVDKSTDIRSFPVVMVDDEGVVKTYVPRLQVVSVNKDRDLGQYETFELPQRKTGQSLVVATKGSTLEATPFDEFGRRDVKFMTSDGKPKHIFQGVTLITPHYLKVSALNCLWEFGIPTKSVGIDVLDPMLKKVSDPKDPDHRFGIARFYVQAALYAQAQIELDSIRRDLPELAPKVDKAVEELNLLQARQFVDELKRRRAAGQYVLTFEMSRQFPEKQLSGDVLQEVRDLIHDGESRRMRMETAQRMLEELHAKLPAARADDVAAIHSELKESLDQPRLDRLDAFLNLGTAENLKTEQKLALAYSGWILGSSNAVSDLDTALRLWQARSLTLETLRTEGAGKRAEIVSRIKALEGIGPDMMAQMIPQLPPRIETSDITPGVIGRYEVGAEGEENPVAYTALPPLEYKPGRAYPLIVALHPERVGLEQTLRWWGGNLDAPGQSLRYGYVVIAPEYAAPQQTEYEYDARSHTAVISAIYDACQRFEIDSDRIYLGGHGMGGDACFDIGFAHPDLFAGVMPISGSSDKYDRYYWHNARRLPFYLIAGTFDRDANTKDTRDLTLMHMFNAGFDLIFAEYAGRGHEHFGSEIGKLFDWMPRHKRLKNPDQFKEMRTLRPTDNRFWWWKFSGIPEQNTCTLWPEENKKLSPLMVTGKVTQAPQQNTFNLQCGAGYHTLSLSPDIIDFGKKVRVNLGNALKYNKFVTPDIGTMLEDYRERGDRQKLVWAKLEF